jgi:hypothetical protein
MEPSRAGAFALFLDLKLYTFAIMFQRTDGQDRFVCLVGLQMDDCRLFLRQQMDKQ